MLGLLRNILAIAIIQQLMSLRNFHITIHVFHKQVMGQGLPIELVSVTTIKTKFKEPEYNTFF